MKDRGGSCLAMKISFHDDSPYYLYEIYGLQMNFDAISNWFMPVNTVCNSSDPPHYGWGNSLQVSWVIAIAFHLSVVCAQYLRNGNWVWKLFTIFPLYSQHLFLFLNLCEPCTDSETTCVQNRIQFRSFSCNPLSWFVLIGKQLREFLLQNSILK